MQICSALLSSPLSTFLNGRFQRELWNAALPLPPFDAAAKSAGRGERTRSLAAEFNAATSAPKSEQPSIIVVAVLTRERVESILTTHLLKNNLVRSLSSRLFKRGFNRAVRPESCLLRVSASASARALSRKSQRGRLFAFIIFPREGKPPDRERHAGGDTRAGAKKVNATKSGDKRRKTQEQRDVHGDRVHAPDILMVSDLIEREEGKDGRPFRTLSLCEHLAICGKHLRSPNYKGRIELEREGRRRKNSWPIEPVVCPLTPAIIQGGTDRSLRQNVE